MLCFPVLKAGVPSRPSSLYAPGGNLGMLWVFQLTWRLAHCSSDQASFGKRPMGILYKLCFAVHPSTMEMHEGLHADPSWKYGMHWMTISEFHERLQSFASLAVIKAVVSLAPREAARHWQRLCIASLLIWYVQRAASFLPSTWILQCTSHV